jgi:hypothetical protein
LDCGQRLLPKKLRLRLLLLLRLRLDLRPLLLRPTHKKAKPIMHMRQIVPNIFMSAWQMRSQKVFKESYLLII